MKLRRIATGIAVTLALSGTYTLGAVQGDRSEWDAGQWQQIAINKYIRFWGGIPPCTWEDGYGQPGKCYWDASERGNGQGYDLIAIPTMPGHDKRIVILNRGGCQNDAWCG